MWLFTGQAGRWGRLQGAWWNQDLWEQSQGRFILLWLDLPVLHCRKNGHFFLKKPESESSLLLWPGRDEQRRKKWFWRTWRRQRAKQVCFRNFFQSEHIFCLHFLTISAGAGRGAQGGEGARQGGGAGAGVAAGGGVLHIGLNFLDLFIIILVKEGNPSCRRELLRFCQDNPLPTGAWAGDGRALLQGAEVPLTGETREAPAEKEAQAEGGAQAGREAPVVGRGAIVERGAIVGRGARAERGVRARPRMEEQIAGLFLGFILCNYSSKLWLRLYSPRSKSRSMTPKKRRG